jgi:hypothetical protein
VTWDAVGVIGGFLVVQTTLLLYIILGVNHRLDEVVRRIGRLEEHLFPERPVRG